MNILYVINSQYEWKNGCWFYRIKIPAIELRERGHDVRILVLGKEIGEEWLNFPDVVIYGRSYGVDPIPSIEQFQERGKKIVYDVDDDPWAVNEDNPAKRKVRDKEQQYEAILKKADVVTTTTPILKKVLKKYNKNVVICPNSIDFSKVPTRKGDDGRFRIGYTGAASHWGDVSIVLDVLEELQKKHDFIFVLQGMSGLPLLATVYSSRQILAQNSEPEREAYHRSILDMYDKVKKLSFVHMPWYPPELYPSVLSDCNLNIGLAPLKDNTFNHSKSCIKLYEYAAVGTPTLASNVIPYKNETSYCAKNRFKDWHSKLEKLIESKDLREEVLEKQRKFVFKNRDIKSVVELWEKAFQK